MMIIKLPDGGKAEARGGRPLKEALAELDYQLMDRIVGAKLDGELFDLHWPLLQEAEVELVPFDSEEAREIYRHSLAHVLAQAVKRLIPEAKLGIGPAIADGFYYDFDLPEHLSPEDLESIAEEMEKIIGEDHPFERLEAPKEDARGMMEERGEPYKLELLEEIEDERVSLYRDGEFIDLCRGPHVLRTGQLKNFKLLEVAGAYWRGDEGNRMLQRIYGTAFYRKEELENYLRQLKEAAERDHRKLGRELDLYSIHQEGGSGLVFWHPKGARIRTAIEDFWRAEHRRGGYELVYTPHIGKAGLWERSGHLDFYRENMYSPIDIESQKYTI